MGAYKQFLIEVEELVASALREMPQADFSNAKEITEYVNLRLGMTKVSEETVLSIMEGIFRDSEEEYLWRLNPGHA